MLTQDALILRKCRSALAYHRKLAKKAGVVLDYDLGDLVELAKGCQQCVYCKTPLSFGFEFDHAVPISWGVKSVYRFDNIKVCCAECNRLKGQIWFDDFMVLLGFLRSFHSLSATDIRRRLVAGGTRHARPKGEKT